jgi:aminopeptidase N
LPRFCWPRDEDRSFWQDWTEGVGTDAALRQAEGAQLASARAAAPFALPGDRKNYLRDRDFDVRHIKIEVALDIPNRQVRGRATLSLEPLNGESKLVELDCEDTEVSSVTAGGKPVKFTAAERTLVVELPEPPATGRAFDVAFDYVSTPQRGIYFTGPDDGYPDKPHQVWTQGQDTDNHHWFPCIDEPKGRLTSEVIATVPASWTAVSNGRLVETRDATTADVRGAAPLARTSASSRGWKTFHWVQDKQHAVYLITLAAGEMSHVVLQEKPVLVDFYCAPGREEDGRRSFGNTPAMIKLYEDLFGQAYPWDKYTQVAAQDFIFGGMENTSATTQTDLTLHDERAHVDFSSDFLVAHEAVHQWFGDLVTCREWPHGWLNEGFATFFESVWQEHHKGLDEYLYDILGLARGYLSEKYRRPIVERTYNVPVDIFDRHLYDKAGVVLHMLRRELGDGPFYRAIRHYLAQHRGRNVLTSDFQRAVEEATGRNMDWFFDQWVYSPGHPDFKVTYAWDEKSKAATLGVRQSQSGAGIPEVFRATVDVAFVLDDGSRRTERVKISEKDHTFTFGLASKPKMVQFDPGLCLLKTAEFNKPKDMLTHQLEHDTDVIGRIEAARGLAKHSSPDSVKALKKAVQKDGFWGVQVAAARALGELRTSDALEALVACAGIAHPKGRRGVAEALGSYRNSEKAAGALQKLVESDSSYYVTSTAAASLGKTRVAAAFDPLTQALGRDSHMEVIRAGALNGLAEFKGDAMKRARNAVTEWTAYGQPARAREAAISALGRLGHDDRETADRLTDLLDDRWYRARLFAIHALEEIKEPESVPAIQRLAARERDGRVVRAAREAVSAIRAGRQDDTSKLREDFNKLDEENRKLRERFDKLEQKLDREKKGAEKSGKAVKGTPKTAKAAAKKQPARGRKPQARR